MWCNSGPISVALKANCTSAACNLMKLLSFIEKEYYRDIRNKVDVVISGPSYNVHSARAVANFAYDVISANNTTDGMVVVGIFLKRGGHSDLYCVLMHFLQ